MSSKGKVVIVDDHMLFSKSLMGLIDSFLGFEVLYQASNGKDLQDKLAANSEKPTVILLDVKMPIMDGFETVVWLTRNYPEIKVLALTMEADEYAIIKMIRSGAKGYMLKDIHPSDLERALIEVQEKGVYYTDYVKTKLLDTLLSPNATAESLFTNRERDFITLSCSEDTYKEIAEKMNLSPKTIDGYRQVIFKKIGVKNRIGLVLYAIRNNLFTP